MSDIAKELTGESEAFVDLEGSVNVGVVDETFPAYCCARFLIIEWRERGW